MYYDHKNVEYAKQLRKNMTPWERKLWYCFLKTYPVRFGRQKPIGHYIVDFFCPKASLILELDGGGHYDPESKEKDRIRQKNLEEQKFLVLRFSNREIDENFSGVCTAIDRAVKSRYSEQTLPQSKINDF